MPVTRYTFPQKCWAGNADRDNPDVPNMTPLFTGADFYEDPDGNGVRDWCQHEQDKSLLYAKIHST